MSRFLVSGGAGFIGSHLCERLIADGAEVVCVDNFITGRPANLRGLLKQPKFQLIERDIIGGMSLEGGLAGIFHLASPASPVDYAKFPIETLRVGAVGSDHMLGLAVEKRCPILVASTSEVYGDPAMHPQREEYWGNVNPVGPRGCYDESKRYLEALTMAYHRSRGAATRIVRIFNTYGPRMRGDDGRVVPNFCVQTIAGRPLTVYGDGSQTRSFCYVDDLVEGLLRAFRCDDPGPTNLGNPMETTIRDFAERIRKLSPKAPELVFQPLPQDDPTRRCPDISKAKRLFDWTPKVALDDGLLRTYRYFEAEAGAKR